LNPSIPFIAIPFIDEAAWVVPDNRSHPWTRAMICTWDPPEGGLNSLNSYRMLNFLRYASCLWKGRTRV
jgi:hypothetical protein